MDSYGLSETLNQQEGLTNEAQGKNQFLQEQINEAMTTYTNKINREDDKEEKAEGEVIGGFSGEVMDAGAKVKGLNKAIASGYQGTFDQLGKQADAIKSGASQIKSGLGAGYDAVSEAAGKVGAGARRVGLMGSAAQDQQRFQDYADRQTQQAAQEAEAAQPEAAGAGEAAAGAGEGAAATEGATAAAQGAEETAGALKGAAGLITEGAGRLAGGAMGAGQLGLDIYKQVEGGGFFKGGVNTGDDIGTITNEIGSVIDIAGAATGDPLLMAAGVGVGLIGSGISGISELFHHDKVKEEEDEGKDKPPQSADEAAVAVQSLAAEGSVGQAASGSSLAQVAAGGS